MLQTQLCGVLKLGSDFTPTPYRLYLNDLLYSARALSFLKTVSIFLGDVKRQAVLLTSGSMACTACRGPHHPMLKRREEVEYRMYNVTPSRR
jgi:hypothetical protein